MNVEIGVVPYQQIIADWLQRGHIHLNVETPRLSSAQCGARKLQWSHVLSNGECTIKTGRILRPSSMPLEVRIRAYIFVITPCPIHSLRA
jgi:hypothetical protein